MTKIRNYFIRRKLKKKYQYCHNIAALISKKLGYENGSAQIPIDVAKNELYQAANIFNRKAEK